MKELRNQFIFAPIKLGYGDGSGMVSDKHLSFYESRSKCLGAVTPEPFYMDKGLREIPMQLGIDGDDKLEGLKKLTDTIHHHGCMTIAHLNHPGRMANPKIPGNYYLSATNKPCENGGAIPKQMNEDDMEAVLKLYTDAAIRAEKSGFDFIELQLGHGYLLAQFLSPSVNDRDDRYGGSFENRSHFPLRIFCMVKDSVNLPIIVRVSAEEMIPNGIKIDETIQLAIYLAERGAAAIHVSAGTVCATPPWFFQHMFIPKGRTWELASQIKKKLPIPVIFVGRVNSPQDIDLLQTKYKADYIALGRALVADPDFVGKYLGEKQGTIRPCLACSEGCLGGVRSGQGLACVVNPCVGQDFKKLVKAVHSKRFAVVGAGLAGLEAALTLKERGHDVVLYEKEKIGGQFNLAWLPPQKQSLKEIVDYFTYELDQKNITVIYQETTADVLLAGKYDGILIATGAVPDVPPIKGLTHYFWAEFLLDENLPENKKIVIIGGGLIGIEIASKLLEKSNEVIIVEMLSEIAQGMEMIEKTLTLKKLSIKKVPIYTKANVKKVEGRKVQLAGEQQLTLEDVDHIVVATGMKSFAPLYDQLKDKLPVYLIGDAKQVGKAQNAIRDAYALALEL